MTFLVERLAELRRHVDHLEELRPRLTTPGALDREFSLRNDVLFSLLMIAQLVIDVAGELAARRGDRFEDYREAVRNLARDARFPPALVAQLERLPGFRNVVVHEYVALDLKRVAAAVKELDPVRQFVAIVADIEGGGSTAS